MDYGRLEQPRPESTTTTFPSHTNDDIPLRRKTKKKLIILSLLAVTLILISTVAATLLIVTRSPTTIHLPRKPTRAISQTCKKTRFPNLCIDYFLNFPGSTDATESQLVHISLNMTLQHLNRAVYSSSVISNVEMSKRVRSAYEDCLELLEDSVDAISRSLSVFVTGDGDDESTQDVLTWLSAAMTNQDTCEEGFADVNGGEVKDKLTRTLTDLSELISNCLALFSVSRTNDFAGVPIQNKRRLMASREIDDSLPIWLSKRDKMLLETPAPLINADITVSQDGNGTCKTIAEAIKKAPEFSSKRTVIWVKAGRYVEDNLKVGKKKINLMFVGDGKGKTVITGGKSIFDDVTTFHTASFAANGAGFIAKDITFENMAGPAKHQAVALRIGADHAVVYHCSIVGYQDTLYVHSNRQFYRECDIYGTVDFIFGNAVVVFQNCNIYARKPMAQQKNTITAQNRKDPNQNTGISIHACQVVATGDLQVSKGNFPTYLGRPWKLYSRVVYMQSYMGDHIAPRGWLEWFGTFALDTLYYGEYLNNGPGSETGQRVNWPGYRVITSTVEANKFTVAQFIFGSSWLPSTGVAFSAGLSE